MRVCVCALTQIHNRRNTYVYTYMYIFVYIYIYVYSRDWLVLVALPEDEVARALLDVVIVQPVYVGVVYKCIFALYIYILLVGMCVCTSACAAIHTQIVQAMRRLHTNAAFLPMHARVPMCACIQMRVRMHQPPKPSQKVSKHGGESTQKSIKKNTEHRIVNTSHQLILFCSHFCRLLPAK